ncbi:hypothetical protein [Corynebacterium timonense]|uniref:hypothetical protein n=1 Tax=Corynebacterium timonense TaxID=441500 RepID=UPI0009F3A1E6|nr:hypothetical protein [Corynebacterium timonense]
MLATLAALVFMFLWRGAAEEANQPPVTVTQTQTETTTTTTTRGFSLLPDRSTNAPEEPAPPAEPGEPVEPVEPDGQGGGSIIDDLLNEADRVLRGQ